MLVNSIAKLSINRATTKRTFLKVFASKQNVDLGRLLIVAHLNQAHPNAQKIIKKIINETRYSYFDSPTDNLESALENALQNTNHTIQQLVKEFNPKWLAKTDMAVIALHKNAISLAKIGNIRAFLTQNKSIIDITGDNIHQHTPNQTKAFENILSGELNTDNSFLLSNENVLDYISQEKIRRIISQDDIRTSITEIEDILSEAPLKTVFAGVLIRRQHDKKLLATPHLPKTINQAEEDLAEEDFQTEEEVEEYSNHEEKGRKPTNKHLTKTAMADQDNETDFEEETEDEIIKNLPDDDLTEDDHDDEPLIKKRSSFKKPPTVLKLLQAMNPLNLLTKLSIISKILIVFIIILGSYVFLNLNEPTTETPLEEKVQEQPIIDEITKQHEAASSALIYDDQNQAIIHLQNGLSLIKQLPTNNSEQTERQEAFSQENFKLLQEARGIKILTNLKVVADLKQDPEQPNPQKITLFKDNLYLFQQTKQLHFLDLEKQTLQQISTNSITFADLNQYLGTINDKLFFLDNEKQIITYNPVKQKLEKTKLNLKTNEEFKVAKLYQGKLYTISTTNDQIIKHIKTLTGFNSGSNWLKEDLTLNEINDLSIDGSLWLLNNNGQIWNLFKGKKIAFKPEIKPALAKPTKLTTKSSWENIYLLDQADNRIIIINKETAKTVQQYSIPELAKIDDFTVQEENKIIYILADQSIIEFNY